MIYTLCGFGKQGKAILNYLLNHTSQSIDIIDKTNKALNIPGNLRISFYQDDCYNWLSKQGSKYPKRIIISSLPPQQSLKLTKFRKKLDIQIISKILNLDTHEINSFFPIQEVSTGLPVIIVPLETLVAVKKAKIEKAKYFELIKNLDAKTILIFCPETYKDTHDLNVRFFADVYGIPEDPATGSANGCLAAYLVKHRYFGTNQINLKVEQGYEIGRPSLLLLRAEENDQKISVHVGGKVEMIAKGEFL